MIDKTQSEHNESGYAPTADIQAAFDLRRFGPKGDMHRPFELWPYPSSRNQMAARQPGKGGCGAIYSVVHCNWVQQGPAP
jgi:hypothetical protein